MKAIDHKEITRYTIYKYVDLLSDTFKSILMEYKDCIINATDREDDWLKNKDRIFNWHFHENPQNTNPDYFRKVFKFKLYSKDVYLEHAENFQNNLAGLPAASTSALLENEEQKAIKKELKSLFIHVGGLLHHVQDMGTPSHVIPIFHGAPAPGAFRAAFDQFETYSAKHLGDHLVHHESRLQMPKYIPDCFPEDTFWAIYTDAANETMQFLRTARFTATVGGKAQEVSCDVFWREYDFVADPNQGCETAGFGQYGPLEKCFGKENIVNGGEKGTYDTGCDVVIDGVQWNINFKDYREIYFQLIRNMIVNSLRCLRLVDKMISARF